jgi:hypothetical protein
LPEISLRWRGRYHWHHYRYEPLRDIIEAHYVKRFNKISGHYERLLESVACDGFRNPIMVSAGRLERRNPRELPQAYRTKEDQIVSEYLGGSRLWAAGKLGIDVPCIVNDYKDVLPDAPVLASVEAVLDKFTDKPRRIEMARHGPVTANDIPFMHLPEDERYSLGEQILIRRGIVDECKQKVAEWLEENNL